MDLDIADRWTDSQMRANPAIGMANYSIIVWYFRRPFCIFGWIQVNEEQEVVMQKGNQGAFPLPVARPITEGKRPLDIYELGRTIDIYCRRGRSRTAA